MTENNIMEMDDNQVPAYLRTSKPKGFELTKAYIRPPYIKVVQSSSKPPLKPQFSDGDIVVVPNLTLLGGVDQPFSFVPIFSYSSFVCFNPMKATQLRPLREMSLDMNSPLAHKCRKFVIDEKCPEMPTEYLKYATVLNFVIVITHDANAPVIPCIMSFKRGEYKTGTAFLSLSNGTGLDMYACQYRAVSSEHLSKGQSWMGLDIGFHPDKYVTEEQNRMFEKLHDTLAEAHKERTLITDIDTEDVGTVGSESTKF